MQWKSRVVRRGVMPAEELIGGLNPDNWRGHPPEQQAAMRVVFERVGWVAPVLISEKSGRVVDGEMRLRMAAKEGMDVPFAYVDLSPEEERMALATFDAIGEMAVTHEERLHALLTRDRETWTTGDDRRRQESAVEGMVKSVSDGSLFGNLWLANEQDEDAEDMVDTEEYVSVWVRVAPSVDKAWVIEQLEELLGEYDVRVEGEGFERL